MPRTVPPRLPLTKHGGIRACAFHRMNPGRIQTELEPNSDRFPSESQTKPDRKLLAAPPRQVNADKLPDILAIWALFLYSIFVLRIVHADWSTLLKIVDSALKHGFSEDDLREIWNTVPEGSVVRVRHVKQPPHHMMLGFARDGRQVELIAYTDGFDWWLFHAQSPITSGFKKEYFGNGGTI
jgi:hypothetical protein